MFLDIETYFAHPGRRYCPGDTFACVIDVQSTFKIKCKYIKVRLRCPYKKDEVEQFRIYEIASQRIGALNDDWDYETGERALGIDTWKMWKTENIVLQKGRNQFIVTCKIPDVSNDIFEENSNGITCSFKVTINANWLPKRCCLDWFVLDPLTAAQSVEKAFDKIEDGAYKVLGTFRGLFTKKKPKA